MDCVIGLGSNLGSRAALLGAAVDLLGSTRGLRVGPVSPAYENPALGGIGPPFLNAAVRLDSDLAPAALLERMLDVEGQLGRVRAGHWAPRTVDLDLLWCERAVDRAPALVVPHPRLTERAFALGPLLDVAPELEGTYGPALERAGGRPAAPRALDDEAGLDDWDRAARALTRAARVASGRPPASPLHVRRLAVPGAGLPGRHDALAARVARLTESPFAVARVALGPADGGTVTVYLVGSEAPE